MYEFRHTFSGARIFWRVFEYQVSTYVPYVVSLHTQQRGKQCWQGVWKRQYAKERILIWVCCICSWHVRDLWISTQITLPRPESHGNCSQMKTHTAPTVSEDDEKVNTTEDEKNSTGLTTTDYSRRTWQHRMWFNGKIVSCRVFEQALSSTSHNNHRITV